jgi:carotenoid cleavage dioxygenase-like enzyme
MATKTDTGHMRRHKVLVLTSFYLIHNAHMTENYVYIQSVCYTKSEMSENRDI